MNLYLRLIKILLLGTAGSALDIVEGESVLRFRVWPNDLDLNMHMNNGRYLTVMDLGRIDLTMRAGLMKHVRKNKWIAVLSAAQVRFRIQLKPFQKYTLKTRIVGWDDKWAYMEQRFIIESGPKKGAVAAIALVKGSFYDPKREQTIPIKQLIALAGVTGIPDTNIPEHVQGWIDSEASLKKITEDNKPPKGPKPPKP